MPVPRGGDDSRLRWFLRGVRAALGIPTLILTSSVAGFAALAMEIGISLPHAIFMTAVIWALPAQLVLIGAVNAGNTLLATAIAVALSSIRLTPMVVSILPEIRGPQTRKWVLYALSHFVAVTAWVIGMQTLRGVPVGMRPAYFLGVGIVPIMVNTPMVALVYWFARDLPMAASASLLLLTPLYFLTSIWGSTRERAGRLAMLLGVAIWPVLNWLLPEFSLLGTGLLGGLAAFSWHWFRQRRPAA